MVGEEGIGNFYNGCLLGGLGEHQGEDVADPAFHVG